MPFEGGGGGAAATPYNVTTVTADTSPTASSGEEIILCNKDGNPDVDSLAGYWKTDEASWDGTANEVVDSSGNANHGTGQNSITTGNTSPILGRHGLPDGDTLYVAVPHDATLVPATKLSINCWVWHTAQAGQDYPAILSKKNGGVGAGSDYGLTIRESTRKVEPHALVTSGSESFWSTNAMTADAWHMITMVADGTNLTLRIDDSAEGTTAASGTFTNTGDPLWICRHGTDSDARNMNGKITEVAIWTRDLSLTEITSLYNSGTGRVLDTAAGTCTVNLPTAVGNTCTYIVKLINEASGTATIDPNGSEEIDGESTLLLDTLYESITLKSDNANWNIIA